MKIVHFSDLHLDAPFVWCGAAGDAARARRQALRDALLRIVQLAREVEADAVFSGGDLYEHEYVTPDTAEFLRQTFADLSPTIVFLAPGNHDWYGAQSLYALVPWSANVRVFTEAALQPAELGDGLTLWGAAHLAPANTDNFLDGFRVAGAGTHLALFHGAERSWFLEQGEGKAPHAPFDAEQIERSGLTHAFLGHYHRPKDAEHHTYPGNPEPLAFGEDGDRGPVIAPVGLDGTITRDRRKVSVTPVHDLGLDVSGCTTRQAMRERLAREVYGLTGLLRLTVSGDLEPTVDVREGDLRPELTRFDAVQIRVGTLTSTYDFGAIGEERTVRGQFVRDVHEADLSEDERRRVLITGLRALEGRGALEVL